MTALIAPVRATSFEGLIFFVYDREAVTKEEDPPENAIVYFYPPSASIEDRISICGQLIGMSHFIHGFIGSRPALCKLQTEKVATVQSGRYTLALGGSLDEPDSLLIRQLETLHNLFTFYHGSMDRIRMMCENQKQFLLWMNVIWDCYLHFVRHYGDFLPGVFDPLPFLNLPKNVAATCFTKASYILQACQRRKHILGGCILYSNSILCTQLEPSITERLILLKPNQSNHPARPVKTRLDLPFGVRILNAFLTLSEYLNLYDALAESAYRQPDSPDSTGAFPDMYMTSSPLVPKRNSPGKGSGGKPPRISSDDGANSIEGLNRGTKMEGRDKDLEGVHQMAGETRKKQRFADESSLPLETKKHPAEHYKTTVEENEKAYESVVCVLPAESRIGEKQNETEASAVLADRKSGQQQIGNEAGARISEKTGEERYAGNKSALLARKNCEEEQNESKATGMKAERKIAGIRNGSGASTFLTAKKQNEGEASDLLATKSDDGKQNGSEACALKVEEKTGKERNESEEVILDKVENNAVDDVAAGMHSSTTFGDCSCESPSYNDACVSVGGIEISRLKAVINSSTAFDSSSCESCLSNDGGLTMEAIDVSGLRVVKHNNSQFQKLSSNGSKSWTSKSPESEDTGICKLILEEVITQVCEIATRTMTYSHNGPVESATASASKPCCQTCAETQKSRGLGEEARKSRDVSFQNSKAREMEQNGHETEVNGRCSKTEHSSVEQDLESEPEKLPSDIRETKSFKPNTTDIGERICGRQPERPLSAENREATDADSKKDHSLRSDLIKTPIVCDSFSVRNLNSRSPEKFLEKYFTCTSKEIPEPERSEPECENLNAACSNDVGNGRPVTQSETGQTERNASATRNSIDTVSTVGEDSMPVATPGLQETKRNTSEKANSNATHSTVAEGGTPSSLSPVSIEYDSEIHITNGNEATFSAEGAGGPVDTALEEVENSTSEWSEQSSPSDPDSEEEVYEEEGDDINQVEGLTHVNLYVQAHSKVVLILLAEEGLNNDWNNIKALWETSLNQLGELEFLVKQSSGDEPKAPYSDEYSFLVYDSFERTMKGNLDELVHQVDHLFCETTKVLHEQFENCSTLKDVMLRNRSSTVYGKRNLGRGTYFHLKGSYRAMQGVPSHRDPFLKLEKRAPKVLNKDHNVNVF